MTKATKQYKEANKRLALDKENMKWELDRLRSEKAKKVEEEKKRYSAIVYCTNCQTVNSVSIFPGIKISECACLICRCVGTLLSVKKVNT